MPAKKIPFNKQVEDVGIKLFHQQKEKWMLANPTLGEEDYNEWLAKQKRSGTLSWESIRKNKFDGKSTLWQLITSDPRVQSEKENTPANLFDTGKRTGANWWDQCQRIIAPIKAKAQPGGAAVVQVTVGAKTKTAAGSALATSMNGLGLHLVFENAEKILTSVNHSD
jgi:hypothetical protein